MSHVVDAPIISPLAPAFREVISALATTRDCPLWLLRGTILRRGETVGSWIENHFGIMEPNPFRWLEDPDSVETEGFVKA